MVGLPACARPFAPRVGGLPAALGAFLLVAGGLVLLDLGGGRLGLRALGAGRGGRLHGGGIGGGRIGRLVGRLVGRRIRRLLLGRVSSLIALLVLLARRERGKRQGDEKGGED